MAASFGGAYGSADGLNEVAGALDGVANRIGARGEGLVLNEGNETNPASPAQVQGSNAVGLNKSFFTGRSTLGREISIFHEGTYVTHGTSDRGGYRG